MDPSPKRFLEKIIFKTVRFPLEHVDWQDIRVLN